jgi:hypothetical protein
MSVNPLHEDQFIFELTLNPPSSGWQSHTETLFRIQPPTLKAAEDILPSLPKPPSPTTNFNQKLLKPDFSASYLQFDYHIARR